MDLANLRKQLLRFKPVTINNASKETLADMLPNIDDQIAKYFLGRRKNNVDSMKKTGKEMTKISESSGKTLTAKYDVKEHTAKVSSFNRCLASCSFYVLKQLNEKEPDTFASMYQRHGRIRNNFAECHGIKPDTNLYYIFIAGLENLIEVCPVLATAMIYWKLHHKDIFFKTEQSILNISKKSTLFYSRLCKRDNISFDELFDKLEKKMIDSGLIKYLETLKPNAKKVEEQSFFSWLVSIFYSLLYPIGVIESHITQREDKQTQLKRKNLLSSRKTAKLKR